MVQGCFVFEVGRCSRLLARARDADNEARERSSYRALVAQRQWRWHVPDRLRHCH